MRAVGKQANEWVSKQANEWVSKQANEWVSKQAGEWVSKYLNFRLLIVHIESTISTFLVERVEM